LITLLGPAQLGQERGSTSFSFEGSIQGADGFDFGVCVACGLINSVIW
jgi:hypothetical protein